MGKSIDMSGFAKSIAAKGIDLYGISVLQDGKKIGEYHRKNKLRKEIRSASKSITSLAVGRAVEEGLFSLDDKIASYFPEFLPQNPQEELLNITIRNLLTMTMGYTSYILSPFIRESCRVDWLEYIFSERLDLQPGERFIYNNACPYLCGALISKLAHENYLDWMKKRFFTPLGINNPQWFTCPSGRPIALGGLFLNVDELSRFGQLCLDGGMWNGQRLVSEDYIRIATCKHVEVDSTIDNVDEKPTGDFAAGYGYFFWMNARGGYRMWGRYGQNCIVLPDLGAVITTSALEEKNEQGLYDCIWEELVPQL